MELFVYIIMVFIVVAFVSLYFMREKKKKTIKRNEISKDDFSFNKYLEDESLLSDELREEVKKIKNMNISEQKKYELFLIKTTALKMSEIFSDIEHINTVKDIKEIFNSEMIILSNFLKI